MAEGERRIAWLRLAVIPLIVAARSLPHPNPERTAFFVAVGIVAAYGLLVLLWVYARPVHGRFVLVATALDVASISTLVTLSGGAFSQALPAYFLVPVVIAFRFRALLTALAAAATVAAYVAQAYAHEAAHQAGAGRRIALQAGFLALLGLAAVLLSEVLERRTARVAELAEVRRRLITDALNAEERERRALAEGLHDSAIQNILSARHDIDEAADAVVHPSLRRADAALEQTLAELRDAVFELHPYVLEQAGLVPALRTVAQRAARHGGFALELDLSYPRRHPHEALLLSGARELLSNVVRHAGAQNVSIRLAGRNGEVLLEIADDGAGFDPSILPRRLAEGHIGLQSQLERVESVAGRLEIRSAPGSGTMVRIRLPA
jgi:two-component system NarL family sensor kinase